ncbi:MAG: 4-hydroxy-tetrahydrodipicolinate reductase [Actinobacteria bacterium]|nr:4-hydroxy-tetrahydrodipicolinate reductase [Actinomycetota bacterium]
MSIKVGVLGAKGRMGSEAVKAISAANDLEVVAQIDLGDSLDQLIASGAQTIVDFTHPDAVMGNIEFAINNGINVVVGTTGFDEKKLNLIKGWLAANPKVGALIAPNFGLGAVLMMQFAAQASKYFESVEIVELHHPAKVDAPSGTAARTAELITQARRSVNKEVMPDATTSALDGARGAKIGDVPVHSLRLRGLVAHQEVILGDLGETLTIRHDSIDRTGFMPGVLLGVRKVGSTPGLTFGLEHFMDLK